MYRFIYLALLLTLCCVAKSQIMIDADTTMSGTTNGKTEKIFFLQSTNDSVKHAESNVGTLHSSDTVLTGPDSVEKKHSASKAALYSAVLPGLGQVYNRKYWKVPIFYGAFAGIGYFIGYNSIRYKAAHKALKNYYDTDSNTVAECTIHYNRKDSIVYTDISDIVSVKNTYRKYLDLSVLAMVVAYGLNIIDAVVDAHLYDFDVSDKLSMQVKPQLNTNYSIAAGMQFQAGLSLSFHFKQTIKNATPLDGL